jgi:hypothetical protein
MNRIRNIRRLAATLAGLAGALLAFAGAAPAALARPAPPLPPGWNKHPPLPYEWWQLLNHQPLPYAHLTGPVYKVPVHTVVIGGMPGWQITLIATGAALLAATAAVVVYRAWATRRNPVPAAA